MVPNASPCGTGGKGGIQGGASYPTPTPVAYATGDNGTTNKGGGGGAGGNSNDCGAAPGANGGSGVVIIVEPQGTKTIIAGGVWAIEEQYAQKLAGNWTS